METGPHAVDRGAVDGESAAPRVYSHLGFGADHVADARLRPSRRDDHWLPLAPRGGVERVQALGVNAVVVG